MQLRERAERRPSAFSRSVMLVTALAAVLTGCAEGQVDPAQDPTDAERAAEVNVAVDGLELRGTLRLPVGSGPHTGIVIAHGSGPSSRRGETPGQLGLTLPFPVPVYEQLAEGFRAAGYAALTFDKRTCGPFNGCADNGYPEPSAELSFGTLVDDLAAVVEHVSARADIDGVVVAGHSKGGTVAAQLAEQHDDLDALVLLATPAVGLPELLATQAATFRGLIEAAGQSGPQADRAIDELESLAEAVADVADGDIGGPAIGGASRAFWASWIDATAAAPAAIRSTQVPVLVVGGAHDWNVLPSQLEAWSPALERPEDDLVLLDDVTHALTRLGAAHPADITPADVGAVVDQRVIDAVTDWLDTITTRPDER